MANPKLRVDVNHNPTKKGIKVQFVMPQTIEGDAKAEMTQKLQSKLNQGLAQYGLTVSQDTDVPYANVIGFLIPIADVKLMIKKAITGTTSPEAPVAEVTRMQELAGLANEDLKSDIRQDLEKVSGLSIADPIRLKELAKEFLKISNQMDPRYAKKEIDIMKKIAAYLLNNQINKANATIKNIDTTNLGGVEIYENVWSIIADIYPELLDILDISLVK